MQPLSKIKEHEAALLGSKVKCNATRGGVPSSGAGLADAPYACIPPWVIQVVSPGATVGPHAGRCCLGSLIAAAICSICHGSALEEGKEKTNTKKKPSDLIQNETPHLAHLHLLCSFSPAQQFSGRKRRVGSRNWTDGWLWKWHGGVQGGEATELPAITLWTCAVPSRRSPTKAAVCFISVYTTRLFYFVYNLMRIIVLKWLTET